MYLPVGMTNTIYAAASLHISVCALRRPWPYLHTSPRPPVAITTSAAPEPGPATTPLCHAGTAQLTAFSVERGAVVTGTSVAVLCHVSRATCHDVVTHGSMWDSSLTSAAERKYLSTEYLLGEDSCDIWSGSGAQNSVWDTRLAWRPGRINTKSRFQQLTISLSSSLWFQHLWTVEHLWKVFLIFILWTLLHFT